MQLCRGWFTASNQQLARALFAGGVDGERQGNQTNIEPEILAGDVCAIQKERRAGSTCADNLREPGQTRRDIPAKVVVKGRPSQSPHVGFGERARTNRAHVSAQHVDELRELVQARVAQDPSDASDPAIPHRPELEDGESTPPLTKPILVKENRSPI